jgi:hypothetical protein
MLVRAVVKTALGNVFAELGKAALNIFTAQM